MDESIPITVSVIIALLGSLGGLAALLKVNADRANIVTDASTKVVTMVSSQLEDHSKRLDILEAYTDQLNGWADRLIDVLERAIAALPPPVDAPFHLEVDELKKERPKRRSIEEKTP